MKLSVIIPAYNEEGKIANNLLALQETIIRLEIPFEIVVVNDGSSDNTQTELEKIEDNNIKIISYQRNKGKGFAIRTGMENSDGDYKLFMDADLSTSLNEIGRFLDQIKTNSADIIVGNRKEKLYLQTRKQPTYRMIFGYVFTMLSRIVTGVPLSDFTCGFKIFTRKAAEDIFSRQRIFNWAFDTEIIYMAKLLGMRIKETPVVWNNDPNTKVRLLRDIIASLIALIKIRINKKHYR